MWEMLTNSNMIQHSFFKTSTLILVCSRIYSITFLPKKQFRRNKISPLTSFFFLKATAVYQAKEKLKSIDKAKKGERKHPSNNFWWVLRLLTGYVSDGLLTCCFAGSISSEEIIKYAHRISASNAVCAPLNWVPGKNHRILLPLRRFSCFHFTADTRVGSRRSTQTLSYWPGNAQRNAGSHGQPADQWRERTSARWRSGCWEVAR